MLLEVDVTMVGGEDIHECHIVDPQWVLVLRQPLSHGDKTGTIALEAICAMAL